MVPFRLTQNLVDGFGVSGYEGVFRRVAEITLQVGVACMHVTSEPTAARLCCEKACRMPWSPQLRASL